MKSRYCKQQKDRIWLERMLLFSHIFKHPGWEVDGHISYPNPKTQIPCSDPPTPLMDTTDCVVCGSTARFTGTGVFLERGTGSNIGEDPPERGLLRPERGSAVDAHYSFL